MGAIKNLKLCDALSNIRVFRDIQQCDLAVAADLSKGYVSQVLSGERTPTLDSLTKLCAALDVPMTMVIFMAENEKHNNRSAVQQNLKACSSIAK